MAVLTDQWNAANYKDEDRQRIYLKDIDSPPVWWEKLKDLLPSFLLYFNERSAYSDGGVAYAGDLMSSLPSDMRADNLQCYIGHEGTYTPSHREMCATLGHNIMVETSTGLVENGKTTKPGSSIWFMTETKDRHLVSEYWLSALGHDIEIEDHFAQVNAWKAAPFKTYVVEQKVGDLILIPPLAPHQVWNRGTRTMKVAWNRTTVETLEMALNEALPKARMVCRDEQYKNKAIVYLTLQKYSQLLDNASTQSGPRQLKRLQKDFRRLFAMYTTVLLSESFSPNLPEPKKEYLPYSSNVICSYCRCNIFNRFLTCPWCVEKLADGDDDCYDICMECYALGRSCACISKLKWVEQFQWKDLLQKHEAWRNQIINFQGRGEDSSHSLLPLHDARERLGKRTLAEICFAELKRRPWTNVSKKPLPREIPRENEKGDDITEVNDDGSVRKRRKIRRSDAWRKQHSSCHICKTPEPVWKLASCNGCGLNYCYGSLFRAFDTAPSTVLEDLGWKCPKCRKICSCGACRRDPSIQPFEPTGTLLGHDTRKVADPRSVESLVDYGHSNIAWLKKAGDHSMDRHETRRLKKKREEAEKAKSDDPTLEDHYVDQNEEDALVQSLPVPVDPAFSSAPDSGSNGEIPVDPALVPTATGPGRSLFIHPEQAVFQDDISDRYQNTEAVTFEYPETNGSVSGVLPASNNGEQTSQQLSNNTPVNPDSTRDIAIAAVIQSDILADDKGLGTKDRSLGDEEFRPHKENRHTTSHGQPMKKVKRSDVNEDESQSGDDDVGDQLSMSTKPVSSSRRSLRLISTGQQSAGPIPVSDLTSSHENSSPAAENASSIGDESGTPSQPPKKRTKTTPKTSDRPQRRAMTEAEKTRKAKIITMKMAQGDIDGARMEELMELDDSN